MFERRNDATFIKAMPDMNAQFVYDCTENEWKSAWKNDPTRYIGYRQIEGDPVSVFDIWDIIGGLSYNGILPEEKITLKARTRKGITDE